jgi:CRP/FNR family transcriptional regulator
MSRKMEIVLRKIPYFADLTKQEMRALATRVSKKHLQRGELLFGEGDSCMGLFMVVTGEIRLFNLSPSGSRTSSSGERTRAFFR